jgi:enoyl-[acyl-carrier protein] reductase I
MPPSPQVEKRWGKIDFLVHAIGFADKAVSARALPGYAARGLPAGDGHLLLQLHRRAAARRRMMNNGGSLLTLSYLGAERVMPHYNVMGVAKAALEASVRYLAADLGAAAIRVNAISAGPIKTLAASGIGDFRYILRWNQLNAPLARNVTIEEVGGAGSLSAVRSVRRRHR